MMPQAASGSYYRWQVPGKGVAVNLSLGVVDRLGLEALQERDSFAARRSEIGGFLLGRSRRVEGLTVVEVDAFEEVECEHAFGASYFLSGSDQRRLAERIRHRPGGGASIVGFFRSNTRKEFALAVEDVDLMAGYFPNPSMVLLLVHLTPEGSLRGGFSIWERRAIRTVRPYVDFPFASAALLAGGYEIVGRAVERAAEPTMAPAKPARIRVRLGWLAASAGLATVVLGGVLHRGSHPTEPLPTAMVEVIRPQPAAVAPIDPPRPVEAPQAVEPIPVIMVPSPFAEPAPAPKKVAQKTRGASRTAVITLPPPVEEAAAPPPALPAAPAVAMALPRSPGPLVESSGIVPSGMPKVEAPFVSVAVEPIPTGRSGILGRLGRRREFVPPRVLLEHSPEVPADLRQRIRDTVPVTVKLYVDRAGKVEYAELLSNGTGPNRDLASLAVFASRKWQFAPAQQDGEPVPAEVVVRFRFGGER